MYKQGFCPLASRRWGRRDFLLLLDSIEELGGGDPCNIEFRKSRFKGINTDDRKARIGRCKTNAGFDRTPLNPLLQSTLLWIFQTGSC